MPSRNKRQKTAASKAEQAMDEACREALLAVATLGDCERLRGKLRQLLGEADAKFARLTEERHGRIRQGRCPECTLQTHDVRFIPLTNENVLAGRCLLCHPAAEAPEAEANSSSSRASVVSPRAAPEEAGPTESVGSRISDRGGYVGDLDAAGRRHGRGRMEYDDGTVYDGEWRDDAWDGRGTCRYDDGWTYDGGWRDGLREGRGAWLRPDGARAYEGEFANDKREGHGTLWYDNGDRYEGGWREGRKEGRGAYTWANGNVYAGMWSCDRKEGGGVYRYADGRVEVRVYGDNRVCGKVVRWSADRRKAWMLGEGKITRAIDLAMAKAMAVQMGFADVP